MEHKI